MLILSWNVAGLSTTVKRIQTFYEPSTGTPKSGATKKKPKSTNSSLFHYFSDLHQADIVCLQEHKVSLTDLEHRSDPLHCSNIQEAVPQDEPSGSTSAASSPSSSYESYWSCCTDPNQKGFNGVVTYVRKCSNDGNNNSLLRVESASARPLGDPELDQQGRCIRTDHPGFVLFNVYVPAGGTCGMEFKMKFLHALRKAIKQVVSKPVILVGDLNVTSHAIDQYWGNRMLSIQSLLRDSDSQNTEEGPNQAFEHQWKQEVRHAWPTIERALESGKVVATQTQNSLTKAKFDKFRMTVQLSADVENKQKEENKSIVAHAANHTRTNTSSALLSTKSTTSTRTIHLGQHESSAEICEWIYQRILRESYYTCPLKKEPVLSAESYMVPIQTLAELMHKLSPWKQGKRETATTIVAAPWLDWSGTEVPKKIAQSSDAFVSTVHPPRQWLQSLLQVDGMVDTFRFFYPKAQGRFTCWNQFTNKRYTNEGCRIDYCLVDEALASCIVQRAPETAESTAAGPPLRCGLGTLKRFQHDWESEEAAMCAATANGAFQPVSFQGGGILEPNRKALDSQFGQQHTGMVYTPPSFSDHIGVSLLLDDEKIMEIAQTKNPFTGSSAQMIQAETHRTQPHKWQQSVASYFSTDTLKTKNDTNATTTGTGGSTGLRRHQRRSASSSTLLKKRQKVGNTKGTLLSHFQRK